MNCRLPCAIPLFLLNTVTVRLAAQPSATIEPGARVRVLSNLLSPPRQVGFLIRLGTDTLVLRRPEDVDSIALPTAQLLELEVGTPRKHRALGATLGLLIGGTVGQAYGRATGGGELKELSTISGLALGALAGMAIGVKIGSKERLEWVVVPLPR